MAGISVWTPGAAVVLVLLLSFVSASQAGPAQATHSTSTIGLLAIDANSQANAATSLGPLDGCSRVEPGAQIAVDYVVDSIPQDRPLIAFEAQVSYDPQLLEVVGADYKLLLAAVGAHSPFAGRTDELPDTDGNLLMSILDTASSTDPEANVERGAGVLARMTFRAKTTGVSAVAITVSQQPFVYPVVLDTRNELVFVDKLGSASIAVGQDCPVEAQQPTITHMAPVNEQILTDNPDLRGATTPPGGATPAGGVSPSAGFTPEGQTQAPDTTPAPSPTTVPCAAPPLPTAVASPTPAGASPSPEGAPPSPIDAAPSPTPTELVCTPTPTPVPDDIVDVQEGSNTPLVAGAAALLTIGTAAAASGWYLYRRSREVQPDE